MEIKVMAYKNINDMKVIVDGFTFTNVKQLSEYIIDVKFKAHIIDGSLCDKRINIHYNGRVYAVIIGNSNHYPENISYFKNVIIAHTKNLAKEIECIKNSPIMTFGV